MATTSSVWDFGPGPSSDGSSGNPGGSTVNCTPIVLIEDPCPPVLPPDDENAIVNFVGTPLVGYAPLIVQFTDLTDVTPDGWSWDTGDGAHSTQNPLHTYGTAGTYTVSLSAYRADLPNPPILLGTETKVDYIEVLEADPLAEFVIAHLWFNGDYTDRSQFAATYNTGTGTLLGTTHLKFDNTTSLDTRYTPGDNTFPANVAGSGTHLSPGNTEFTVEFWYYEPAIASSGNQYHFSFTNTANGHGFRIYSPNFKGDIAFDLQGGGPAGSVNVTRNAWHHVALTRSGGTSYTLWLDGVSVQTHTNSTLNTGTHLSSTCSITIGSGTTEGSAFASEYTNFRFTRKCRYTAPFSVPTIQFPDPVP